MAIIEVQNLIRDFQNIRAVDQVNFQVLEGELFGFLGPNGAGKSTVIKILCTLLSPTSGTAKVNDYDITNNQNAVRRSIGIIFQDPSLDDRLTAWENLEFHAMLYKIPYHIRRERMKLLLEMVDLTDRQNDIVKTFSGGMKRRLEIARGLLHSPKILFLDEPTLGLDPQTRVHIWNYLRQLRQTEGTTLFMTTHYMEEAEYCDRIGIIDHGKIIALDTPKTLKSLIGGDLLTLQTEENNLALEEIKTKFGLEPKIIDGKIQIRVNEANQFAPRLLSELKIKITSIHFQPPTLEDVFIQYTGREIRDQSASSIDQMRQSSKRRKRPR